MLGSVCSLFIYFIWLFCWNFSCILNTYIMTIIHILRIARSLGAMVQHLWPCLYLILSKNLSKCYAVEPQICRRETGWSTEGSPMSNMFRYVFLILVFQISFNQETLVLVFCNRKLQFSFLCFVEVQLGCLRWSKLVSSLSKIWSFK